MNNLIEGSAKTIEDIVRAIIFLIPEQIGPWLCDLKMNKGNLHCTAYDVPSLLSNPSQNIETI